MDNFANRYTMGKIRLGKQPLGNFENGSPTLGKLTRVYLPWLNLPKVFYLLWIFDEFSFDEFWFKKNVLIFWI